jgi:hypothetical protein
MIRIINTITNTKTTILGKMMRIGQIGWVKYGTQTHLVLRTYKSIVSLEHPKITWSEDTCLEITLLKPNEVITLELFND